MRSLASRASRAAGSAAYLSRFVGRGANEGVEEAEEARLEAREEDAGSAEERRSDLYEAVDKAIADAKPNEVPMVQLTEDGKEVWRPASSIKDIINSLGTEGGGTATGSDVAIAEIIRKDAYAASVETIERRGEAEHRGAFYNGVLSLATERGLAECGIDLKLAQVFSAESMAAVLRSDKPEIVTRHCLWSTIRQLFPDEGEAAIAQLGIKELGSVAAKKRVLADVARIYGVHIKLLVYSGNNINTRSYNKKQDDPTQRTVSMGMISNHFFPNRMHTPVDKDGDAADLMNLITSGTLGTADQAAASKGSKHFRANLKRKNPTPTYSTIQIINKLEMAGMTLPIPASLTHGIDLARSQPDVIKRQIFKKDLYIPETALTNHTPKGSGGTFPAKKYTHIWYADFETSVDINKVHKPYLAAAVQRGGGDEICVNNVGNDEDGASVARGLLKEICTKAAVEASQIKGATPSALIYFHNLKYDSNFLWSRLSALRSVESAGNVYEVRGRFPAYANGTKYLVDVTCHDTFAFIQTKLAAFPSMFNITCGGKWSEVPYDVFTLERMTKHKVPISEMTPTEASHFGEKYRTVVNGQECIDLVAYSSEYCLQDCRVLQQGFDEFHTAILGIGINVDTVMTSASIAKKYIKDKGCLDGVEPLSGIERAYVQETVVGGRVCIRGNKALDYTANPNDAGTKLVNFDAVSLYPSAMAKIKGLPLGFPTTFGRDGQPKDDTFYVATVRVLEVGKELNFSTLSSGGIDESRKWGVGVVKVGDVCVLNNLQIDSAVKYQGVVFEFIGGLAWLDGYNEGICETIRHLFAWRLRLKKEKNPLQMVVKLIMNSAYGKLCERPHIERIRWFRAKKTEALMKAAEAGSGFIYIEKADDGVGEFDPLWKLKYRSPDVHHSNYAHAGGLILAKSKEIMFEVTTPLDSDILYTDTDSMILPISALGKLNRPDLIGSEMGQFHTDLAWEAPKGTAECGGEVSGDRGLFLAKKTYCIRLRNTNAPGKEQFHVRTKGIPGKAFAARAKKDNRTPLEMFAEVAANGVNFDITMGGVRFKQNPTSIVTVDSFHRKAGPHPLTRVGFDAEQAIRHQPVYTPTSYDDTSGEDSDV